MLKTLPVSRHRSVLTPVLLGVVACLCVPRPSWADDLPHENCGHPATAAEVPDSRLEIHENGPPQETPPVEEAPCEYRSYAMLCMANAYPGLKSEELINNLFDPIMGVLAPGIERVNTFGDMRDNHLLWVPNAGGGYNISRHFSLFLQLGYGAGPARTKDSAPSLFVLPLDLYFKMTRRAFTITPGLDYFPFGMVEQREYHGLMERLRAIRPMLGVRVPWTHAGYSAKVHLGLGPDKYLVNVRLHSIWEVWSTNVNLGFDVPINLRNQVNVNLGRSFFFGQNSDFGGTVFSVTWKYLF